MENVRVKYYPAQTVIYWDWSTEEPDSFKCVTEDKTTSGCRKTYEFSRKRKGIAFPVKSGHKYEIQISALKKTNGKPQVLCNYQHSFRAEYTKNLLQKLLKKTKRYVKSQGRRYKTMPKFMPCKYLYRDKDEDYFKNILEAGGVMETYIKDQNGDPANCINGELNGLFFSVCVDIRQTSPTYREPFPKALGEERLLVPVTHLVAERTNLYFADFYCMFSLKHWVTLVLTIKLFEADNFCSKKLVKLDKADNPFLYITSERKVEVTTRIWVELYYTENIDLLHILKHGGKTEKNSLKIKRRHGGKTKSVKLVT